MDGIVVYLSIGTLWCFITDVFMTQMENNNTRKQNGTLNLLKNTFLGTFYELNQMPI